MAHNYYGDVYRYYNVAGESKVAAPLPNALNSKAVVQPVNVSFEGKNITDIDIERIAREAIIEQRCTELDLKSNRITHEGAAILAKALRNNKVQTLY